MLPVDLHVHSNRSDGTYTPGQLVDYAMEKGLAAFALTDHDTVDGLDEAISHGEKLRRELSLSSEGDLHPNPPEPAARGTAFWSFPASNFPQSIRARTCIL